MCSLNSATTLTIMCLRSTTGGTMVKCLAKVDWFADVHDIGALSKVTRVGVGLEVLCVHTHS